MKVLINHAVVWSACPVSFPLLSDSMSDLCSCFWTQINQLVEIFHRFIFQYFYWHKTFNSKIWNYLHTWVTSVFIFVNRFAEKITFSNFVALRWWQQILLFWHNSLLRTHCYSLPTQFRYAILNIWYLI